MQACRFILQCGCAAIPSAKGQRVQSGFPWSMGIRQMASFCQSDAGRSTSKRPRQGNDCTVRALAIARGLTYDEAYELLRAAGRRSGGRFSLTTWLKSQPWATYQPFPAVRGQRRMNPYRFCREFQAGAYICRTAKHVFAVVDGIIYDIDPPRNDRCVYCAWAVSTDA